MGKTSSDLNFHPSLYSDELEELENLSFQDVIASYKKKNTSKYRGVHRVASKNGFQCEVKEKKKKWRLGQYEKVNFL